MGPFPDRCGEMLALMMSGHSDDELWVIQATTNNMAGVQAYAQVMYIIRAVIYLFIVYKIHIWVYSTGNINGSRRTTCTTI